MITINDYVGEHAGCDDWTPERQRNAVLLLEAVNSLIYDWCAKTGNQMHINPATHSQVSGQTFGGFRPQDCPQGSPHSSHKEGMGVDVYDPKNELDDWLNDTILARFGLYREAPQKTQNWCHLTTRKPLSGNRTFWP